MLPPKDGAKDAQHAAIAGEDVGPDGLARLIGDVQRDKVRARGRRTAFERDGDGDAVEHAAEDDVEQGFAQNGLEREDAQEEAEQRYLNHGEDDEALADAAPAEEGDGGVERQHAQ